MTTITRPSFKDGEPDETVTECNFCGRRHTEQDVVAVVQGPSDIAICDRCVDLCADIVSAKRAEAAKS